MATERTATRPSGDRMTAGETRAALIAALIELLDQKSITAITVREVAARAGVNHGLVHRYFGSRDKLVEAAVREMSSALHRGDPIDGTMSAATFATLRANPGLARLTARACLDGPRELLELASPEPERLAQIVEPIRAALRRMRLADTVDAHLLNALASAAFLGWFVFKPLLREGFGLGPHADDELSALLERLDRLVAGSR